MVDNYVMLILDKSYILGRWLLLIYSQRQRYRRSSWELLSKSYLTDAIAL